MKLKDFFPFFKTHPNTVYLDSAATAQKPKQTMKAFIEASTAAANINRAAYPLSIESSNAYEQTREAVAEFCGGNTNQFIFTKNATESLNLAAHQFSHLKKGDVVLTSVAEHHSNFLPWMELCKKTGATFTVLPVEDDGTLNLKEYEKALAKQNVAVVTLTAQSNVVGHQLPLQQYVKLAHQYGAKIVLDGTQHIVHNRVNLKKLDCDFYAFSAHKLYSIDGVGILYAKDPNMKPLIYGGGTVEHVSTTDYKLLSSPAACEAGTPPITNVIALKTTLDFLNTLDWKSIEIKQQKMIQKTITFLKTINGIKIIGNPTTGCISFVIKGKSIFDIATLLGEKDICVRSGMHCTEPLHKRFGIDSSLRISFGLYNDESDVNKFIDALTAVLKII